MQLNFFQQKDLGFDNDQILVIRSPIKTNSNFSKIDFFKEKIKAESISEQATFSSSVPGDRMEFTYGIYNLPDNQHWSKIQIITSDDEFLQLFNFKLLAGRNFNDQYESDKNGIVINEIILHNLGYADPQDIIGHEIQFGNSRGDVINDPLLIRRVIGVIDNYHHLSPKSDYLPISLIQ